MVDRKCSKEPGGCRTEWLQLRCPLPTLHPRLLSPGRVSYHHNDSARCPAPQSWVQLSGEWDVCWLEATLGA